MLKLLAEILSAIERFVCLFFHFRYIPLPVSAACHVGSSFLDDFCPIGSA